MSSTKRERRRNANTYKLVSITDLRLFDEDRIIFDLSSTSGAWIEAWDGSKILHTNILLSSTVRKCSVEPRNELEWPCLTPR